VRNSHQRDLPWQEVAQRNRDYCCTGLSYPTASAIRAIFGQRFGTVRFVEAAFIRATSDVSAPSAKLARLASVPGFDSLYRGMHTRVLLCSDPLR
jgi:hypothetical protein